MKTVGYSETLFDIEDAIIHDAHTGFREDYLIIHSLLRKYKPKSLLEVGTNVGSGLNVIGNAIPEAKLYSLDLDYATMMQNSKQYPIGPNGEDRCGSAAKVPYTQLRGDSVQFDYSQNVCEAYFIDGEHDYEHPYIETIKIADQCPRLIIWHDADIDCVFNAIKNAMSIPINEKQYEVFRVNGTRIAYAVWK